MMHNFLSLAILLCLSSTTLAFPTVENIARLVRSGSLQVPKVLTYDDLVQHVEDRKGKRFLVSGFETPVDVHGSHEWQEPDFTSGAQRGPCPGLNAMANHGYIDRSGVASLLEVVGSMNEVFGMSVELGMVLSVMGTVWTGDPLSLTPGFSLDGESPQVQNLLGNLLGLLGEPRGIARSHNWLEADASLTRDDLYVTGDASTMNMDRFMSLYNRPGPDNDIISSDDMVEHSIEALNECIASNPYCWYGPYTGLVARNAGIAFAARLLSNHTAENPNGIMTKEIFKSMWGVVGDEASLQYKRGWERIPENWYKTPVDYSLVSLNMDLVSWLAKYPQLASIGGNTGTVDSFTALDIANVTGGVMNAQTLLEGNNLLCFAFQIVKTFSPDSLSTLYKTLGAPLSILTGALGSAVGSLTCPPFQDLTYNGNDLWNGLLSGFEGPARSGSAL